MKLFNFFKKRTPEIVITECTVSGKDTGGIHINDTCFSRVSRPGHAFFCYRGVSVSVCYDKNHPERVEIPMTGIHSLFSEMVAKDKKDKS